VRRRTQAGLAVSANGRTWHLINASPDLRQQILVTARLWPDGPVRSTPIASVVIMSPEIDQIGGLLTLREAQKCRLFATPDVLETLATNLLFRPLVPAAVEVRRLAIEHAAGLLEPDGEPSGLTVTTFAAPGKAAMNDGYLNVGLLIGDAAGSKVAYLPTCASVTDALIERLSRVDLLFFDGSFWSHDEMAKIGQAHRSASSMGHLPISGPEGSLAMWTRARIGRKIFIHINNTNPILIEDSAERRLVEQAGWGIASDGQEYSL
jgi:pyrroloquinoline quinone biosynthesis protein B